MRVVTHEHMDSIAAPAWNAVAGTTNPFLRHAFFAALEHQHCVGAGTMWQPHYLAAYEGDVLAGVLPMFIKHDSFGEFVFDWSWAQAYESSGRRYYPKLVVAVPFTPVTGRRLLVNETSAQRDHVASMLVDAARELASRAGLSSLHFLFTDAADSRLLSHRDDLVERIGYQYHWYNPGYRDFNDFLNAFTSKKRKNVLRDRRLIREAGVEIDVLTGAQITGSLWNTYYGFYASTMRRKGNINALSAEFFHEIGEKLPENIMLVMARQNREYVGGAFFMHDADSLYGRYWGCNRAIPGLHFEVCYYRPIEFCIERGLQRFEAGAQGEHKIDRGFVPVETRSAHWIADPAGRAMIEDFVGHERRVIASHIEHASALTPYKRDRSSCASTSIASAGRRSLAG
ncbi:MAG: hypothetical protein FD165_1123 [Gammaproteobacteria bacterium]|nr:MAG: hypothetical protein FD165_1123 [Gammaproteobacteria bacterium]TND07282.1 MAG: hypothetical protein FD120_20 [Gammaproteobacteria bacterium]